MVVHKARWVHTDKVTKNAAFETPERSQCTLFGWGERKRHNVLCGQPQACQVCFCWKEEKEIGKLRGETYFFQSPITPVWHSEGVLLILSTLTFIWTLPRLWGESWAPLHTWFGRRDLGTRVQAQFTHMCDIRLIQLTQSTWGPRGGMGRLGRLNGLV